MVFIYNNFLYYLFFLFKFVKFSIDIYILINICYYLFKIFYYFIIIVLFNNINEKGLMF